MYLTADILTLIVEEERAYIRDCDECNDIDVLNLSEFCYFRGTRTH